MGAPKAARRIGDELRMKARAKWVGKIRGLPGKFDHAYNHLKMCSCEACGNPRRSEWATAEERRTMQERRFYSEAIVAEGDGG